MIEFVQENFNYLETFQDLEYKKFANFRLNQIIDDIIQKKDLDLLKYYSLLIEKDYFNKKESHMFSIRRTLQLLKGFSINFLSTINYN